MVVFICGLAAILTLGGDGREATWHRFSTPAGPVECFGSKDSLGWYDLSDDCVEVDR
jgi:hypothetical protein